MSNFTKPGNFLRNAVSMLARLNWRPYFTTTHGVIQRASYLNAAIKPRRLFTWTCLLLIAAAVVYTLLYLANPALPGNNQQYPLGWWGWWDQSHYLKQAQALGQFNFSPDAHIYPPLYALLAAPFTAFWPMHAFFVEDFTFLALYLAVLAWIGGRIYGPLSVWPAAIFVFLLFPGGTIVQWVIPWSTSVVAALGSVLFAIYFWFSHKRMPWQLETPVEWLALIGFFASYGGIFAARPIDVFVFFPIAVVFFLQFARRGIDQLRRGTVRFRFIALLLVLIAISGLIGPAIYLAFNTLVFGHPFGGYIALAKGNGYFPADLTEKAVSLLFNSDTIYVEARQAIADQFPLFLLIFPVTIVSAFVSSGIIRLVAITILFQFVIYFPYADLLPNGMFRFLNIHYFKWTFPWMAIICVGELIRWAGISGSRRRLIPILATILLIFVCANLRTVLALNELHSDVRNEARRQVILDLNRTREIEVIDLIGVTGQFTDIYFGAHELFVDNLALRPIRDFRMLPAPWGTRIVLILPQKGRRLVVNLGPSVSTGVNAMGQSRIASVKLAWGCRFFDCSAPISVVASANRPAL